MPLSETPQKLSEKIDLQKLQDIAAQDIPDLLMGFRNLNEWAC